MNARVTFPEADDTLAASLPGVLRHLLTFTATSAFNLDGEMAAFGISRLSLKSSRLGKICLYRVTLKDLAPSEARRLTDRLAARPGVIGAQVEHLISL